MAQNSTGLVSKLIEKILIKEASIEEILRNCLYIGTRLNSLPKNWSIKNELEGYNEAKEIPPYRIIPSRIKAFHPLWGFRKIENLENTILNNDTGSWKYYYPNYYLQCPIGEIEEILSQHKNSMEIVIDIPVPLSDSIIRNLQIVGSLPESVDIVICKTSLRSSIESLKNSILNWAIELQKLGIDSDGVDFTEKDRILAEKNAPPQLSNNKINNFFYMVNSSNSSQNITNSKQNQIFQEGIQNIIKSIENPETLSTIPFRSRENIEKELDSLKNEQDPSKIRIILNNLKKFFLDINKSGAFTALIELIKIYISAS